MDGQVKELRKRVQAGETVLGCFLSLGSPLTAEIVASAGWDWLMLDLEHGSGMEREVLAQLQAVEHTGAAAVVRVESNARQRAHRVLDLGAHGVMFPRIETVDEARAAVAGMRYPPEGLRGVAFSNRACGFGSRTREYMAWSQTGLTTVIQIESEAAVANAEAIAAIDGVDVLFVGPSDLSHGMGIFQQFGDPRYVSAVRAVAAAAKAHGKAPGILLPKPDDLPFYLSEGYTFIASGNDGVLLNNASRGLLQGLRRTLGK
ncbi:MAG: 2-dehydro-3-deoxyglucarate aldolase [Dehalococcoidia bacterium]|nr:2-dehydro-3-deoxyglucarate aldolase [Dehalococcoidia bacterium]